MLRLDAQTRTLLFFGAKLRIEEFFLFLIAVLIFVIGFLFVTMVFGRVWCGWLCPQTTVTDLADYLDNRIAAYLGKTAFAGGVRFLAYLCIACLMAANLVWYFITPYDFFPQLWAGNIGMVAGITLFTVSLIVMLDLLLVRRVFCKSACPYGRIQLMTMDRNTLTLEFDPAAAGRCINCHNCEKVCPMGIDIKQGLQVECINCGQCIDACRSVMNKRDEEGIIHYTFGQRVEGGGRPLNMRSLLLGGFLALLLTLLFLGVAGRKMATIKIQHAGGGEALRLRDGSVGNFYSAYLENRSNTSASYDITVSGPAGSRVELLGKVQGVRILPNENRRIDFLVKIVPSPEVPMQVTFNMSRDGRVIATATGTFPVK